jgi:hypothetical protein
MTMEDNRAQGLREYDPGYGNESYKLRMTNNHYALGSAMVYKGIMRVVSHVRTLSPVKVLEDRLNLHERMTRSYNSQVGGGVKTRPRV